MSVVIYIASALQLGFSVLAMLGAKSAMHETTAAVAFGAGVITLALARLVQLAEAAETRRKAADQAADLAAWKAR